MRCPKCGFHTFDHLDSCKKCNADLRPYKTTTGITAFRPVAAPPSFTFPASSAPLPRGRPAATADLVTARRGGFWIRFVAQMVDGFILTFIIGLLLIILFFTTNLKQTPQLILQDPGIFAARLKALGTLVNLYGIVLHFLYYVYFHGSKGQTAGKKLFGLKVIQTNGQEMTYLKALVRYLGYFVNQITLMIGFIWAAFDKNKQGFHDKIAGTYVVRLR